MKHNYEKLKIWNDGLTLATTLFKITMQLPVEEKFGLINQMRRAAYSDPSNIVEGASRSTNKSFGQFLSIALGSLAELHTQMLICHSVGYLNEDMTTQTVKEIVKQKNAIRKFQDTL